MRRRIAAMAVIAVGLMLALAGCTFFAPQATLIPYDASDGVSLNVGDIQLRNALVISPNGTDANLVGVFINTSDTPKTVSVQYRPRNTGSTITKKVTLGVGRHATESFGNPGVAQFVFTGADVKAGSLLKIFVQYGGVTGKIVYLPVLDGAHSIYSNLTPSPTPTSTGCSINDSANILCATGTPTPTPTPTTVTN